jgi:hypothetical protein
VAACEPLTAVHLLNLGASILRVDTAGGGVGGGWGKGGARVVQRKGRAGQGRAGQGRAGQGRAGQGRAGQGRAEQGRAEQGEKEANKSICMPYRTQGELVAYKTGVAQPGQAAVWHAFLWPCCTAA